MHMPGVYSKSWAEASYNGAHLAKPSGWQKTKRPFTLKTDTQTMFPDTWTISIKNGKIFESTGEKNYLKLRFYSTTLQVNSQSDPTYTEKHI